jgi:hypothetical protein
MSIRSGRVCVTPVTKRPAAASHATAGQGSAIWIGDHRHAPNYPATPAPAETARSLHDICEAARLADCGHCWAVPGEECAFTASPVTPGTPVRPVPGYHVARFGRAYRRGLVSAADFLAVTDAAGVFTADAIVYDKPGGAR